MRLSKATIAALTVATAVLIGAGCGVGGDDGGSDAAATTPAARAGDDVGAESAKGTPKALVANRAQAGEIIDEGTDALDAKLAELEGQPVVVNQWASWCEPCRAEFPFFRDSAELHQKDVAFLGIDMQDDRGAAEDWLAELPVPYPHIWDPDATAISALGGGLVSPTTAFIDENGEVVFVFQGSYASRDQLEEQIETNLLAGTKG